MAIHNKNKNELLVLTGAVYSFVAYLTAFTLEVLFIIDLAKRNNGLMTAVAAGQPPSQTPPSSSPSDETLAFDQTARWTLESMQTHVTISCLAVSVLYFITFIASLILIVALILRSTFFLLIWMCIMTTLYLPEFGLIIYVSIYGWGLETRNGQAELLFYLFRAMLNVIFIIRAYKLFKEWNYEKNFYMLKSSSGSSGGYGRNRFTGGGYDSPYFIGDSLTTTINPVFSSSTLNLNRYDQIREPSSAASSHCTTTNHSPATTNNNNSIFPDYDGFPQHHPRHHHQQLGTTTSWGRKTSTYLRDDSGDKRSPHNNRHSCVIDSTGLAHRKGGEAFYLHNSERQDFRGDSQHRQPPIGRGSRSQLSQQQRQNSMLSIDDQDDFLADYEMDLDYRTLTNQRHYNQQVNDAPSPVGRMVGRPIELNYGAGGLAGGTSRSPSGLSYSTQSLDRRHLRDTDLSLPDQVILRPLARQPFDYLHRPGSTSNLNSTNNLNTQP